jgi:hypothetical protein
MRVFFEPKVQDYLEDLIPILYENNYFGFEDAAVKYINTLIDDIYDNLPLCSHKPAPPDFEKYGKDMYYAVFRKSKQTVWYIFFNKYNENSNIFYLVRYIANNHVIAQQL